MFIHNESGLNEGEEEENGIKIIPYRAKQIEQELIDDSEKVGFNELGFVHVKEIPKQDDF